MHGRSTIWFPLALLALLAALTLWIDRTVQPPQPKPDGSSRHDPDYKVSNFTTTKSDLNGNPRFVLSATELTHYPDDDSAQMTRPRFTQYSYNKPYTQIQGQRGQVSSNGEDVYFMDHVKVVRAPTPTRGELTVLTEYLHLIPDQDIAVTDRPVSILQAPATVIRGSGMEYNKSARTLEVYGRVHVHYVKPGATPPNSVPPEFMTPAQAGEPQAVPQPGTSTSKVPAGSSKSTGKKSAPVSQHQPKTGKSTTRIRRQYDKPAH
ncbi:lipopolysaccharide-assembly, LptC-related [mine drainage metagenome]|uniref:Lipopolysaccharide-assembly, LptC-related n=1 Tax=mine drainage metagenome TaxID=410659 RepID=A0A1J5RL76_9ZZZZ